MTRLLHAKRESSTYTRSAPGAPLPPCWESDRQSEAGATLPIPAATMQASAPSLFAHPAPAAREELDGVRLTT